MSSLSFRPYRALFFCALGALPSVQLCLAQQAVEPWKAPHFSVEPKALYEAASAAAAPEGANVSILIDDESYTFDDTGRMNHGPHHL